METQRIEFVEKRVGRSELRSLDEGDQTRSGEQSELEKNPTLHCKGDRGRRGKGNGGIGNVETGEIGRIGKHSGSGICSGSDIRIRIRIGSVGSSVWIRIGIGKSVRVTICISIRICICNRGCGDVRVVG